jgi:serine/threonine protein kinase
MSPEQLTGDRLDGRSDVYSLGVVIFRMLTGALPFNAASAQDIMVQRLTADALRLNYLMPGRFPQALSDLLQRSLARKANDRPASARDFARELRQILSGPAAAPRVAEVPPTRVQPAPSTPAPKEGGRPRPVVLVSAGVLVLAIALIAFVVTKNRNDAPSASQGAQSTTTDAAGSATPNNSGQTATNDQSSATRPSTQRAPAAPATEALATVLNRQLEVLQNSPSPATLLAVRDTALRGWNSATSRSDSATAALVLAQAALASSDNAECARWARAGAALGRAGFEMILNVCQ